MRNALILAKNAGMDVYNALNILDNEEAFAVISSLTNLLIF
jgi:hypothetical protein